MLKPSMTVHDILLETSTSIARRDAELLLAHTLRQPRTYLIAHPEAILTQQQRDSFESLTKRRAAGVPLQYLTGMQEFFGLEFHVTPAVLIPRPETEHLVEAVLNWSHTQVKPLRILDIGTGSGAIAIAVAANEPSANITATDISPLALNVARDNALRLGVSDRIRFVQSDLFASLNPGPAPFDAIVSNPPYVPATDAPTMQREVVDHEPHTALFAGPDGLMIYRRLIPLAYNALRESGLLALEFGFGQTFALTELLRGWNNVRFLDDYAGIPRVALAERP
jgi:release factor glutamine methyltransferase